jgi:hypothetical protein
VRFTAWLVLIATLMLWSGNWIVARAVRNDIAPGIATVSRLAIVLAILLPFAWNGLSKELPRFLARDWKVLAALGFTGGGLHLVSDYEHDERGRMTRELGPEHTAEINGTATSVRRATWHVHKDLSHEQRTAQGYCDVSGGTYTLINPVSIAKLNRKGHVREQIQAVRSSTSGRLSASDSFSQSDYVRWTTRQYSDCCTLISERIYHTLPSTGEGSSGTHYNETQFGYDSMKRRNRTVSPGGTIRFDVFDVRGQAIAHYVGTDDSGASESDPTGGEAGGNNMLLMRENEYDSGDGNLTRHTQHADDTTTRVTVFVHDWRNRQVEVNGEIDHVEHRTYDNLGGVVRVEPPDHTPHPPNLTPPDPQIPQPRPL